MSVSFETSVFFQKRIALHDIIKISNLPHAKLKLAKPFLVGFDLVLFLEDRWCNHLCLEDY